MTSKSKTPGIRKAAILVASLDSRTANLLLERFPEEEAKQIRQAAIDLGDIAADEQRRVIEEFRRLGPLQPDRCPPGIELDGQLAEQLVRPTAGESAEPRAGRREPFRFLREAESEKLVKLLAGERPQVVALVLSHLTPDQAGKVLIRLPPAVQADVIARLVDLEETDPEILQDVERGLQQRLAELVRMQRRRVAGLSAVAGILDASGPTVGTQILDNLARYDRSLADRLNSRQVDFCDLFELDQRSLARMVAAAERELVVLALVGAPPAWAARFLSELPEAEARAVRRELEHPGPTRLSDVEEARRRLAELAHRLAVEGKIELPRAARTPVMA